MLGRSRLRETVCAVLLVVVWRRFVVAGGETLSSKDDGQTSMRSRNRRRDPEVDPQRHGPTRQSAIQHVNLDDRNRPPRLTLRLEGWSKALCNG